MNIETNIEIISPGRINYDEAWDLQKSLKESLLAGNGSPSIIILEHDPTVITVGRHGKENNIRISEEIAQAQGVEIRKISRGGDVTVHEKGQLVLYFIFPLPSKTGAIFADTILKSLQLFCLRTFNLNLETRRKLPGLWTGERKIASIGLDVTSNVSMHGMSLNVANDLKGFSLIRPCGMDGQVTSVSRELGKDMVMEVVLKEAAAFYRKEGGLLIKKTLHTLK